MKGKVAIITGAANGIGNALTKHLSGIGWFVYAVDLDIDKLKAAFGETDNITCQKLDISNAAEWERLIKNISSESKIDYLFNIAGIIKPGYIHETDIRAIDQHIDINLKGTIYGCHYVSKVMAKQGNGHIINLASMAGIAPIKGLNLYSASKYGVRGFTLAIRQELKPLNIDVSVVCPDAVQTNMLNIQKDYEEAAMTFSGQKILSIDDVIRAIMKEAIKQKKAEVWIPKYRGALAIIGNAFPKITSLLSDTLTKQGKKKQQAYKKTED